MPKVAIVTDSIACLTRELAAHYDIEIVPIVFYAGGKSYRDGVDITPSEAYQLFLADPESFKTSAASPEDCLNVFRRVSRRAGNIVFITVSNKLSAVYNSALEARELAKTELPGTTIELVDSRLATPAEGFVALAAARAAAEGQGPEDVVRAAEAIRDKAGCFILLDTIRHVYRSGRIPKIASQVGSILNIRPILSVSEVVHFLTAVRSREKGIERILQLTGEKVGKSPVHVSVFHAYAPEEAERLKERVAAEFNCVELWLGEFSPVMGYACGTGTVGVAFYTDD
ncbi:MAG: DegV family protein [Dehalococcoidales bacterium]